MAEEYRTVNKKVAREIIIKKSRFIAHVSPIKDEEEAKNFIKEIKKKHWQATHNVSAYVAGINTPVYHSSDDGEPSGTAGKPVLEVIKNRNLTNVVIVITRYFGGIKLGAGGLIRAYSRSAAEGIKVAGEVIKRKHRLLAVEVDYSLFGMFKKTVEELELPLEGVDYRDKVTLKLYVPVEVCENYEKRFADITGGSAVIKRGGIKYLSFSVR